MGKEFISQSISPERVLRGDGVWEEGKKIIRLMSQRPLLLGRSYSTKSIRERLFQELSEINLAPVFCEMDNDCCEKDLNKIDTIARSKECDSIIATGGGKVLDAGKLLSERLEIPCVTIPLSAATCAGWTALSNIYSPEGKFIKDQELKCCPKLLIFDHNLIKTAPLRTLSSGIADALAKWYEASISCHDSQEGLVEQAVQMSRVLRDQLIFDGVKAINNINSEHWIKVTEACALTAGLIGGIGGSKCRTAAAHALHNGLTQLNFSKEPLHGELVGFGILVQLKLEEKLSENKLAAQSSKQLTQLLKDLNIPITLDSLGLENLSKQDLYNACSFSCKPGSDIYNLPYKITPEILFQAVIETNNQNQVSLPGKWKKASRI